MELVPNGRIFEAVSESYQIFLLIITRTVFITTYGRVGARLPRLELAFAHHFFVKINVLGDE